MIRYPNVSHPSVTLVYKDMFLQVPHKKDFRHACQKNCVFIVKLTELAKGMGTLVLFSEVINIPRHLAFVANSD